MMKKVAIVTVTAVGTATGRRLQMQLKQQGCTVCLCVPQRMVQKGDTSYGKGELSATIRHLFKDCDCLVCIMATGIVVRMVADVLVDKTVDPAVLVMDERAHHVISLLSGHVGGANEWARLVGQLLKADPVITTATDTENVQALDVLAKQLKAWYPNFKANTKLINGRLAAGKPVELYIEPYLKRYVDRLTGFTPLATLADHRAGVPLVLVSDHSGFTKSTDSIQVVPRVNILGVGCRRNVTDAMMQAAFSEFCQQHQLLWQSVVGLASIDVKRQEGAIQYLARTLGVKISFFTATELKAASQHYPSSSFVEKTVGVGNVACAAAETASGEETATPRYAGHEITIALSHLNKI